MTPKGGGFKMRRETQSEPLEVHKNPEHIKFLVCPKCKSKDYIKSGYRNTEKRGKIQRYECKQCEKRFCMDDGFFRMRNNNKMITKALDLYYSSMSSRKLRDYCKRHEELKISHVSILDWCRRYALKIFKFVDRLQPELSGKYYADETEIMRGGCKDNFWVCLDWDTRYIPAIHYSLATDIEEAKIFLQKANQKKRPIYLQTDSAQFYHKAFRKTFAGHWRKDSRVEHIALNVWKHKKYNVRIETVFSKIKDRVKLFRGLKQLWSAPILMTGIVLQHNLIQEHTSTKLLPSETAKLDVWQGVNRWLSLINQASLIPIERLERILRGQTLLADFD